jgi:hypothetical protein
MVGLSTPSLTLRRLSCTHSEELRQLDVTQHQQQARQPQQAQHLPMSDEPPSLFAPSVQSTQVEGLEAGKWSAEQPKDTGTSEEEEVDRLMEILCLDEQGISVCRMLL